MTKDADVELTNKNFSHLPLPDENALADGGSTSTKQISVTATTVKILTQTSHYI